MSPAESATIGTKRKERDFEAADVMVGGGEETNINVVVRCRGRSQREVKENSTVVVNADGVKGQVIELSMGANALSNKTYSFDRVFSPAADQSMVFDDVVKPILEEVGLFSVSLLALCCGRSLMQEWFSWHMLTMRLVADARWLQLHDICLWPDRDGQDVYNVGRHVGYAGHAV